MNERIRQLADIAKDFAISTVDVNCKGSLDEALDSAFEQKFAELIVRECARAVDKVYETAGPDYGCYDWGATFADGNDVLKHFGVEK